MYDKYIHWRVLENQLHSFGDRRGGARANQGGAVMVFEIITIYAGQGRVYGRRDGVYGRRGGVVMACSAPAPHCEIVYKY